MRKPEFPLKPPNQLYLVVSGVAAGVVCHLLYGYAPPFLLATLFGWIIAFLHRYLVSRGVERALRQSGDPTHRWSRYRLLGLSTRMASYYFINVPKVSDTPKPIIEAVEDADLVLLANVQYLCVGMGIAYWGLIYALRSVS